MKTSKKASLVLASVIVLAGAILWGTWSLLSSAFTVTKDYVLVSGSGWDKVSIIDKAANEVVWEHALQPGDDSHDAEMTKEGNILYSYRGGARLVNRNQELLWDYKAKPGEEMHTATQMKDGGYCLASCGKPSRIVLLDKEGKQVREFDFDTQYDNVHLQFRHIYPTDKGTFVFPILGRGLVVEMDGEGKFLKEIPVPGNPFGLTVLENGHWLVGCGDAGCVVEVNPETKEVTPRITNETTAPYKLYFVAEVRRLDNGNTLVVNWRGHTNDRQEPSLYEVDPQGKVVWALETKPGRGEISAVYPFAE